MSVSEMRKAAEAIITAAIEAVKPEVLVNKAVRLTGSSLSVPGVQVDLSNYRRVIVVGAGKATARMAAALEDILGFRVSEGVIVIPDGGKVPLKRIRAMESGHPIPDERGVAGAKEILSLVRRSATADTLTLCLISGGGSALLPYPVEGISLTDKQQVTKLLLACGASISELNAVRKHLSRIKGGQLARAASPARVISIILSDVVNDPLETIASGLTAPDPSTFSDVVGILKKYQIWDAVPETVRQSLTSGARGERPDTPKMDDPDLLAVSNIVIGNNRMALHAASDKAQELGFAPLILTSCIEGEAREVGTVFASIAKEVVCSQNPIAPPACILAGGETTVTIRGKGKGGRNQELALSAAIAIAGLKNAVVASVGTDGRDGPTDAAGAIVDGDSVARAAQAGISPMEFLARNDSYNLHVITGDLLVTGATGTNVMDLLIALLK